MRVVSVVSLVIAALGMAGVDQALGQYCQLYAEQFESFGGPADFDNGTYRVEWCESGNITTSNPCGTGNSLRLSGSSEDPIIWVYVDSQGCTEVKLEFQFAQYADSGTVLKYATSDDTELNCSEFISGVAGSLDVTGGACYGAEHTVVVSGQRSVYWKFDHGSNSNAIFIDNLTVSLQGCDCEGGEPSHDCCEPGAAGCDDPVVEACVCALDPYCCNVEWDAQCVAEVESFSCGSCGGSGCATEFSADFGRSFQSGSVCTLFPDRFESCEGNGPYISSGTACGGAGDYVMSFASGYPYSAAITECLDLSGAFSASLEFSYAKNDGSLGPRIEINTDGGSFTTLWSAPYSPGTGCHEETVSLASYVGESNVRLKFSSGSSSSNGAALDDILLQLSGSGDHSPCETGGPGSDDPTVTACVCAIDPYCCETEWDALCVMYVDAYGCGDCGGYCLTQWSLDFGDAAGGTACDVIPVLFETCEGDGPTIGSSSACGGTGDMAMIFESGWPYSAAITRCLDLSAASEARLEFTFSKADGTLGPAISVSTDGGSGFTHIWDAPFNPGSGCLAGCVDLTPYAGLSDIRLKFSSDTMSPSGSSFDDLLLTFDDGCVTCAEPVANAGDDTQLCAGGTIALSGSAGGGSGGGCPSTYTINWSGPGVVSGGDTFTPTVDAAGTYTLTVTCGDCQDEDDVVVSEETPVAGDMNCDCSINNFDIDPFVLALTSPSGYAVAYPDCDIMLADIDGDGTISNFDIDPFVALLGG